MPRLMLGWSAAWAGFLVAIMVEGWSGGPSWTLVEWLVSAALLALLAGAALASVLDMRSGSRGTYALVLYSALCAYLLAITALDDHLRDDPEYFIEINWIPVIAVAWLPGLLGGLWLRLRRRPG